MTQEETRSHNVKCAAGTIAIIICSPLAMVCSVVAAIFLLNEFVNGLVPSRWLSGNGADWIFGTGAQGSARNYVGFMLSAVPASMFWTGAKWGLSQCRQDTQI